MSSTRREFLKTSALTCSGIAFNGLSIQAAFGATATAGNQPSQAVAMAQSAKEYTRGIGVYPGLPSEYFGPTLIPDSDTYRNLALRRPAFHSSSYDYNLTAQLVTDGIRDTRMPSWVAVTTGLEGPLPKESREYALDHSQLHRVELQGPEPSITIEIGGGDVPPEVDRVQISVIAPSNIVAQNLKFTVEASDDGRGWTTAGELVGASPASLDDYPPDFSAPGRYFTPTIRLHNPHRSRFYRIGLGTGSHRNAQANGSPWALTQVAFFNQESRVEIGGPYSFTSAWMSAGLDEEWVYVDLGAVCTFDRIKLFWIARAAEGSVQISDNAMDWRDIARLEGRTGLDDDIAISPPAAGQYVRVLMTRPSEPVGYVLSEVEVYGRGGFVARSKSTTAKAQEGVLNLAGSAWRIERASQVEASGKALSIAGYKDEGWLAATVPGTVLTSYLNAGAIPDPNFGENQLHISDSYFCADFWYRTEFTPAPTGKNQRVWLNIGAVNWKADVFLNGQNIGQIDGGFLRGHFDVTELLKPDVPNALALCIKKVHTPGSTKQKTLESVGINGGALGRDNPTYHASIGWDWIPTIRGRNTGILGPVTLETTGEITLENPYVWSTLPLPDTSTAEVHMEIDAVNHSARRFQGVLSVRFGDLHIQQQVELNASERRTLKLTPASHPELKLASPKLWWPAGYGEPYLYDVEFSVMADGSVLDRTSLKAGIRQMSYSEEGGALRLWINGRRFIARGGNWGFSESMLRYRDREYDAAVRYHRDMNFTMIRNWVGQINDDAFWEACDRHGVVVWQDFWLANPWDGPRPDDFTMFLKNARDYVLRIRNHPSMGLYCGRNEGFPPQSLDKAIRNVLQELHPDLHYIPSSADKVVSGHGPYRAMPISFYFNAADTKLHSEIGAPTIPSLESVRMMMPARSIWPQSLSWGLHDFCLNGAQGGAEFCLAIETSFGGAHSAEEWIRLARIINYDTYRAMFEAQSKHRMGVLLWMSHPCWPSFVWQTYDYYFEPTAAYFGSKKGSEPLHIQWNCLEESVEVVNYSAGSHKQLTAEAEVLNLDGVRVSFQSAKIDIEEDATITCFKMSYPAQVSPVHFIRLNLKSGNEVLSSNFYLRPRKAGDYRAIRELPTPKLQAKTTAERVGDVWRLTTDLHNSGTCPALMIRVAAVGEKTGERILPAMHDDNYIALMPGESRVLKTEVNESDTRGEKPTVQILP